MRVKAVRYKKRQKTLKRIIASALFCLLLWEKISAIAAINSWIGTHQAALVSEIFSLSYIYG
jgi:hypothetical protein